jgi:uncharacterized OB-fold protein
MMAIPNLWRTKQQRYRLQAEMCPVCSQAVFPPREICPHCHQALKQAASQPMMPTRVETPVFALAGVTSIPLLAGAD